MLNHRVTFALDEDLLRSLETLAERNRSSLGAEIRRGLADHVVRAERRHRIEQMTDAELDAALLGFDEAGAAHAR